MERQAILNWMQYPPHNREEGPVPFLFNISGPIGILQSELDWRLFDFCRIHQIVYDEIENIEKQLDEIEIEPFSKDIDDPSNLNISRKLTFIMDKTIENNRIISFVDHITIVGLWAIAEQFLGKIYRAYLSKVKGIEESEIQTPYKWNDFDIEFQKLGIDIEKCENYLNANECRILNNAIKHTGTVNSALEKFEYFKPHTGQNLEKVPLEMQRYLNGVSNFLGSLIENGNKKIEEITPTNKL